MKKIKLILLLTVLLSSPLYASIFWNQEAIDAGHQLPPTFGLSIIGATDNESISADNLSLTTYLDLAMGNMGFKVTDVDAKVETKLVRFDAWIFPFLNVYALAGRTDGEAKVSTNVGNWEMVKSDPFKFGLTENMHFDTEFGGETYGGGLVLAGGYKDFFTVINYTFVTTKLDILSGSVMAQTLSATTGYKIIPNLKVWTGVLYENIDQRVSGLIPPGMLPQEALSYISPDQEFTIHARATHPLNPVIGAQYTFMKKVDLTLEGTVGHRQAVTAMLSYRF